MTNKMEIKTIRPQRIVSIRTTTKNVSSALAEILPEVGQYLVDNGIQPAGPPLTIYHNMGAEIDLEGGVTVTTLVAEKDRIKLGKLPGGEVAVTRHIGPYEGLGATYDELKLWIMEQGREPTGSPWEIYWSDPSEETDSSKWETEIFWPVI